MDCMCTTAQVTTVIVKQQGRREFSCQSHNKLQNKGHQEKDHTEMEGMGSELRVLRVRQAFVKTEYLWATHLMLTYNFGRKGHSGTEWTSEWKMKLGPSVQHKTASRIKPKYFAYSIRFHFRSYLCQEVRFLFREISAKKQHSKINLSSMKTL